MVLSRLTKITGPGIATDTNWVGNNADFTGITTTATSFNIGVNHLSLISSSTMPSTFYLGFYWHEGSSGHINFNRQENDNGGNAVSGMMVFELEDVS